MKVLTIDGGGIRGLIPARVLEEIERRCGRPAGELFDLVAGTSTGAIIACALTKPQPLAAGRIARIYLDEGPEIFSRSLIKRITSVGGLIDERYESDGLLTSLRRHFGEHRLTDAKPAIMLTAYDLEGRSALLLRNDRDMSMVDAAHGSSAAPSYFEPARVGELTLVDGGVFATNPAMCAYADVARRRRRCSSRSGVASSRACCRTRRSRTGASWSGSGRRSTSCSTAPPTPSTSSSRR